MKRFLLLYSGPPAAPEASHAAWPDWFNGIGDALVDVGSPTRNGVVLHSDGSTTEDAARIQGYSIIQADDRDHAIALVREHPILGEAEYAVEIFEIPKRR